MLRDVFYYGNKPNVHPKEKFATSIEDARSQCTTEHFWIINEFCDYQNFDWDFDFEFLPDEDVWAEEHNNVWPSQHQKDSGTWLCSSHPSEVIIYRADVIPIKRKNIKNDFWLSTGLVDETKFDFSWHPDPTEPDYIYEFGTQWHDRGGPRYVPKSIVRLSSGEPIGQIKYVIDVIATLVENKTNWVITENIDVSNFDFSWVPHPDEQPYIYQFGTQWQKTGGPKYIAEGATDVKYVSIQKAKALPIKDNWIIPDNIDVASFDFSWHPDGTESAYIYEFGTQWQISGGPKYVVDGATEIKYVDIQKSIATPTTTNWDFDPTVMDVNNFDFSWHPYSEDESFVYQFGTQWQKTGGPKYITPGVHKNSAIKYIDIQKIKRLPNKDYWEIIDDAVIKDFDYSWHPDSTDETYIYVFGNNLYSAEIMPTIQYVPYDAVRLASGKAIGQVKYVNDIVAILGQNKNNWKIYQPIDETKFDFSWIPNPKDPAYIYVWGNKYIDGTLLPTIEYHVPNSNEKKYMNELVEVLPEWDNWLIPDNIDKSSFDFTWRPDPREPAFIYEFATQWHDRGGPKYIHQSIIRLTSGKPIGQIKYIHDTFAKTKQDKTNWAIPDNIDTTGFDFSWIPHPDDPPYIYEFGTQWQKTGGPSYLVEGASEVKYVDIQKVKALPYMNYWEIIDDAVIKDFDYSWHPDSTDEPYLYVFGNNLYPAEIMPSIQYVPHDAIRLASGKAIGQIKYVNDIVAILGQNKNNWIIPDNIDTTNFDFSWVPNPKDPSYIYEYATQWNDRGGIKYVVPGANEYKYVDTKTNTIPNKTNWIIPDNIDTTGFDFSWIPHPDDPPYIYQFGTQWQKTGGPKYIAPGIVKLSNGKYLGSIKYVGDIKAIALPSKINWDVPANIDPTDFNFSWHPDDTENPYIYQFGTQWQQTGGPRYVVEGATEIKYVHDVVAKALPNKDNWEFDYTLMDINSFDFSWHPNAEEEAFIYQFGTQWQKTGGPRYLTPGIHKNSNIKYIDLVKIKRLPLKDNFIILDNISVKSFDYSWHPDDTDEPYIYVFGNNQYPAEIMPTIQYIPDNAVRLASGKPIGQIKYVNDLVAILGENKNNWDVPKEVDATEFDFSWVPHPHDDPYIYQFGTQWQKTNGVKYISPGIVKLSNGKYLGPVKYVEGSVAKKLSNTSNWQIPSTIDVNSFDFSWHPDETDAPFIYQFGTQWQKTGGPRYIVEGAIEIKYIDSLFAKSLGDKSNWEIPAGIDINRFDFSWHPDAKEDAFIYQFGTQWQKTGGPRYIAPNIDKNSAIKYIDTNILKAIKLPIKDNFKIPDDISNDFDFSWHPDDTEEAYIYQFGTQWQKTGGPTYVVEGATETKYVELPKAKKLPSKKYWFNPNQADVNTFDYSWHPDETAPPYIYQFGTLLNKEDGPRYMSPNTNGEIVYLERMEIVDETLENFPKYMVTTTLEELIKQHPNELFWALNPDLDYSEFDFDWRPSIEQAQYVHAFGSSDSETTQTYLVNSTMWEKGFRELNWVIDKKLDDETLFKLFKKSDMFFVDRSNDESKERFEKLKQQFPNLQKTRYLNSWVETITRCINRSTTELCWILNSELDYTNFNFEYYPNPWQMKMVQVFGTQWSNWGTTFMVNRETFAQDTKHIKIIEHLSNLNFVKDRKAKATNVLYDIVYVDHGNKDLSGVNNLIVKYQDSYIATFQKMLDLLPIKKEHYIWVVSTICDYKDFDFTYICDPFAKEQLHVFPSDRQQYGDTFLIDVNRLRTLIEDMNVLEDYVKINYNQSQRAKRLSAPVIITEGDTHVSSIDTTFNFPYAVFMTKDNKDIVIDDIEPMSLWTPESKNIQITSVGGTRIVIPKEAKDYVKRELYDYPYIITNSRLAKSSPMDIVFLSNGETGAEENYQHLLKVTEGLHNRVTRVDGVNGRVAAYHAAAKASNTPWMFTVFAKLKVSNKFDWNWQPDRLQLPKHYVFHATNPVNGLKYGHMAMIAYNKSLTLDNQGKGLDFTMDDEHEVLEINSGTANFNTDEWSTWRTAFREALKLCAETDEISKNRLDMWLTVGMGKFNEYSTEGAQHAVEYFNEVNGDFDKLKLSYDWPWLRAMFDEKYK